MPRRGVSLQTLQVQCMPNMGLDYSQESGSIPDNALTRALNFVYDPLSGRIKIRFPFSAVTADANVLPGACLGLYPFFNGTTQYLLAACDDGNLYYMTQATLEGGSAAWTLIGALTGTTIRPSFLTWNGKCLIADGHTAIRYWDGTTYGTISNSPSGATCLTALRGRAWANSTTAGAEDAVYGSAAEFSGTDWNTGSGAVTLRVLYGDLQQVVGLAAYSNYLIVAKQGSNNGPKSIKKVDLSSTTTSNWFASDLLEGNTAQNCHSLERMGNELVFVDSDGIHGLSGSDQYGDVKFNAFGAAINAVMAANSITCNKLYYSKELSSLLVLLDSQRSIYLYSPGGGWTTWNIADLFFTGIAEINSILYLSDTGGRLLKYGTSGVATDTYGDSSTSNYQSIIRTKMFRFGGYEGRNVRAVLTYMPIEDGQVVFHAIKEDESTTVLLASGTISSGAIYAGDDATLAGDNATLAGGYSSGDTARSISRQRFRDYGMMLQSTFGSGARVEIFGLSAEISAPIGR